MVVTVNSHCTRELLSEDTCIQAEVNEGFHAAAMPNIQLLNNLFYIQVGGLW